MPPTNSLFALPADMLYLDCAAHGPPLHAVREAASAALKRSTTSWFGASWREDVERVRALAAGLFDGNADGLAFVPSAAYGLSIAARNVPLWPGQSVLVLDDQFPSNLLPWRQRCKETGASLSIVQRAAGQDWTDAVLAALDADTDIRVLALPQVHWRDGALLDMDRIAARARARKASLVLDLSQSLGVLPVQLDDWQPDFIVSVGYKWLMGGFGLAWLWAAPQWRDEGQPLERGWMAHDHDALWQPGNNAQAGPLPGARRYDAGGVCDAMRLAMAEAGLRQVLGWGVSQIAAQLKLRTGALDDALHARDLDALRTAGHAPHICGLPLPPGRADAVAKALETAGIVATLRHDCVRIAPHMHVGIGQMARVADVVASVL